MAKPRGLYGQAEGNESNPQSFAIHCQDNQTVEGAEVETLRRMFTERKFNAFNAKVDAMRKAGWSHARINVVVTGATCKVRI
jgi:hypothetical protein